MTTLVLHHEKYLNITYSPIQDKESNNKREDRFTHF